MEHIKTLEDALKTLEEISASLDYRNISDKRIKPTLGTYLGLSPHDQVKKRIARVKKDMSELISYIRANSLLEDYKETMPKTKKTSEIRSKILINKEKRVIKLKKNIVKNLKTKNKLKITTGYTLEPSYEYDDTIVHTDINQKGKSAFSVLKTPIGQDQTFINDFDKVFKNGNNPLDVKEIKEKLEDQIDARLNKYEKFSTNFQVLKKIKEILHVFHGMIDRNLINSKQAKAIDAKFDLFFADVKKLDELYRKKARLEIYIENFYIFTDGITEQQIKQDMLKIKASYEEELQLINKEIEVLENKVELNSPYDLISKLHVGEVERIYKSDNFVESYPTPELIAQRKKMVDGLYEEAKTSFPTRTLEIITKEETKRTQKEQAYTLYLRKGKNFYGTFGEYIQKEYLDKGIDSGFDTVEDAVSYEYNVNQAKKIEESSKKRR